MQTPTVHTLCVQQTLCSPLPCCSADQDATHIPVQHRQIGMVFQSYALFRHMTVADNISFGPRIQDLDIDEEARYSRKYAYTCILHLMPRHIAFLLAEGMQV